MSPREFAKVDELFNDAMARPATERRAFLREAAGDDTTLFDEVWALLEHHDAPHDVFEVDAAVAASKVIAAGASSDDATGPERIGRYRILHLIDRGGMGVVYLAEQDEPRRQVAMKVLQSGMVTPGRVRRFAQEVQLLARLRHPGIAQVYDAGSHDFGDGPRPWFAMEYIDGLPITEFSTTRQLSAEDRLRLMISVCDAVQHAHHRGVIHRDLKPGNIFVSTEDIPGTDDSTMMPPGHSPARPKVLDFGIARATDRELGQSTMHTQEGQLLGTLPYMSPEQVAGDSTDADDRSDVYALGVILYELLAGRLPYNVRNQPLPTVVRTIAETDPAPLSTSDRSMSGDLEQIARKALAKDRRERYQSASALADDLLRYLNHEPVLARAPSAWYQWRKFARRNRALVTSAAVLLVVLLASTIVSTSLFVRAERESRAREEQITETQWQSYIANITAAHSAIREGRAADARRFLELAPAERRGWEWRHLHGLLDRATLTLGESRLFVEDAIFTYDGSSVITGDDEGHLHRYDALTGAPLAGNELAHSHWIHDLDLRPGGGVVATASSDRTIGLHDAATLETIRRLGPFQTPIRTLAWAKDGASLFCGLVNGQILRLDPADGRVMSTLEGHSAIVEKLALSSDGRTLVSCSGDMTVRLWDTDTGRQRGQFETESGIFSVCMSPDDRQLACTMVDGYVSIFEIDDATRIAHWKADVDRVICAAFSPDSSLLVTGSQTSRLRLWETTSWRMAGEWLWHSDSVRSVTFSSDGRRVLSASNDHTARIWNLHDIGVDAIHDHDAWVYGVKVSADGTRVASSAGRSPAADGSLRVFDLLNGAELHRLEPDRGPHTIIFHFAAKEDLSAIVTHWGSQIHLWRPGSAGRVEFDSEADSPSSAMTSDGRYAAVAMWLSPRVHALDLETEDRFAVFDLTEIIGADTGLSGVEFNPAGDRLVVVADDADTVAVLTWPEGRIERVHTVSDMEEDPVLFSMAFSPDGRRLAMAFQGHIDLFDFDSWDLVASLPYTAETATPRFSPDGSRLFAGCSDGAVRIWDLPSRRLVGTLYVHPASILDLDISADGSTIVTGSIDTAIRVLRAAPGPGPPAPQ